MILLAEKGYSGNLLHRSLRLFDTLDQAVQFCIDRGDGSRRMNKTCSFRHWRFFEFSAPGAPGKTITKKGLEKSQVYAALPERP